MYTVTVQLSCSEVVMAEGLMYLDAVTSSPVIVHGIVVGQVALLKTSKSNSDVK